MPINPQTIDQLRKLLRGASFNTDDDGPLFDAQTHKEAVLALCRGLCNMAQSRMRGTGLAWTDGQWALYYKAKR